MRLKRNVKTWRLALVLAPLAYFVANPATAQEQTHPVTSEAVALSDTAPVQDITASLEQHRVNLGAGSGTPAQQMEELQRSDEPWFGLNLANRTSLPMERLLVIGRPLLAGAGWTVGTASSLPGGSAVYWVGAGAPELLIPLPGSGGAGVYRFELPATGTARLAVRGAEGPVTAAVMTQAAHADTFSLRYLILGLGFGLLGVLSALSLARWLGAGDRAAAASAGVGLAGIWVLATQFDHHLPLTGAGNVLDSGLKAAGLFLLSGALLFSIRMQADLSDRILRVLTWGAIGCAVLAVLALPGWAIVLAAGPVLLVAAISSLAAAVTDAVNHRSTLSVRLPDLASLSILVIVLAAAAILAAGEPTVMADRWSTLLYGIMIVCLAILGGSGLIVHHGVEIPLLMRSPAAPSEASAAGAPTALGPEPVAPSLAAHEVSAKSALESAGSAGTEVREPIPEPAVGRAGRDEEMLNDLRDALSQGDIRVAYQPVLCLADGSVSGFEALARWDRKGHGPVPPDKFIPLAEDAGLIDELGAQVLATAARKLGEWQRRFASRGSPLNMNVNVSVLQLHRSDFAESVRSLKAQEDLSEGTLTLEITEGKPFGDMERTATALRRLKEQGVKLALDDFGSGYASFDALRRLPFDTLKIDHSLMADIGNERERRIITTIIELAHDLGLTVVAEGVGDTADIERLRSMKCDFVQGPFCGPPLAAVAAESVLERNGGKEDAPGSPAAGA